jgi:hypothetical protein
MHKSKGKPRLHARHDAILFYCWRWFCCSRIQHAQQREGTSPCDTPESKKKKMLESTKRDGGMRMSVPLLSGSRCPPLRAFVLSRKLSFEWPGRQRYYAPLFIRST